MTIRNLIIPSYTHCLAIYPLLLPHRKLGRTWKYLTIFDCYWSSSHISQQPDMPAKSGAVQNMR